MLFYEDETIPARDDAAGPPRRDVYGGDLPERLRGMLALGEAHRPEGPAAVFRLQAEFMAGWECEEDRDAWFSAWCPVYTMMSGPQLLSYFAWRTRLLRGELLPPEGTPATPLSARRLGPAAFACLYVTELLNGAGADSPLDAWRRISDFWERWRRHDFSLDRFAPQWLDDLVVWAGLDRSLLRRRAPGRISPETARVAAVAQTLAAGEASPGELLASEAFVTDLFAVIDGRSAYHPERSVFWAGREGQIRRLAAESFLALRAGAVPGLAVDAWIGVWLRHYPERLFKGTVFDFSRGPAEALRALSPSERWVCRDHAWSLEEFRPGRGVINEATQLLRIVEAELRRRHGMKRALQTKDPTPGQALTALVRGILDKRDAARRAAANPARRLDFSRLDGIRADALETQERLIVPGSENDTGELEASEILRADASPSAPSAPSSPSSPISPTEPQPVQKSVEQPVPGVGPEPVGPAPKGPSFGALCAAAPSPDPDAGGDDLSAEDRAVLGRLLAGESVAAGLPGGDSPEIFADRVNGLLFERIGDAVLECGAGASSGLSVIEDYREDLEMILKGRT